MITTNKSRFQILTTGQADVVFDHTTIIPVREATIGIDFLPVTFYTGSTFMVKVQTGVKSAKDLNGATFCTIRAPAERYRWPISLRRSTSPAPNR